MILETGKIYWLITMISIENHRNEPTSSAIDGSFVHLRLQLNAYVTVADANVQVVRSACDMERFRISQGKYVLKRWILYDYVQLIQGKATGCDI